MTCQKCDGRGFVLHDWPPTIDCPDCVAKGESPHRPVDESVSWAELDAVQRMLTDQAVVYEQRADFHEKMARRWLILTWAFGILSVAWAGRLVYDVWGNQ